jgi:hypothetical protein
MVDHRPDLDLQFFLQTRLRFIQENIYFLDSYLKSKIFNLIYIIVTYNELKNKFFHI